MVPDGCPPCLATLARWQRNRPLTLDAILCGAVRTCAANSPVTDSAAAATAMACGVKTAVGTIGVSAGPADRLYGGAERPPLVPMATVLEAARRSGRSVGLVVTCSVADATPAAFAAHGVSRKNALDIAVQLAHQDLDVVFGGGRGLLLPVEAGGRRTDGADLRAAVRSRGCRWVETPEEMAGVNAGPVWGIFADGDLTPLLDRATSGVRQPTLAEMTRKALALLRRDPDGFLLLIEGSLIDHGCHANDAAYALSEFMDFDAAADEVLAFAAGEGRGQTLVIACADHETGGFALGNAGRRTGPRSRESLLLPLQKMTLTSEALAARMGTNRTAEAASAQLLAWWDVRLPPEGVDDLQRLLGRGMLPGFAMGETTARYATEFGWACHDHTAADVLLWAFGPGRPAGLTDNTGVAAAIARALGADLAALSAELFADLGAAFPAMTVDRADPRQPVARVGGAELPINRDVLRRNSREERTGGLTLLVESTGKVYVPRRVIERLRAPHP
jgi:alkaline phosphatase